MNCLVNVDSIIAAEDYSHMSNHNQRREQDNTSNKVPYQTDRKRLSMFCAPQTRQVRVRNTQPSVAIDLTDAEEYNESNLYQTFSDRLATGTAPAGHQEYQERNHALTTTTTSAAAETNRPDMLYSDAVRYGRNGFVANLNYKSPSSSLSSSEPRLNGHGLNSYESSIANRDNVLVMEDQRSEHNQYINLINNLTLYEQERPLTNRPISASTAVAARDHSHEKPTRPPPPLLQPLTHLLNGDDWMRGLLKRTPESRANDAIERQEFAKLLERGTKQQLEQQIPMLVKKPPELVQCYSHVNNTSNIKTNSSNDSRSKSTTINNLTDDYMGRNINK